MRREEIEKLDGRELCRALLKLLSGWTGSVDIPPTGKEWRPDENIGDAFTVQRRGWEWFFEENAGWLTVILSIHGFEQSSLTLPLVPDRAKAYCLGIGRCALLAFHDDGLDMSKPQKAAGDASS